VLRAYAPPSATPPPPSPDMYAGEPFQDGAGFGIGNKRVWWTVRARVSVADPEAGNKLLLRLLDPQDTASVEAALAKTDVAAVGNEGAVSGLRSYSDTGELDMLGAEWRVEMFL